MARHRTRMLVRLGVGAWAVATLPPVAAQQPPLVSLTDGLHQVAKMKACQRAWNLHIAEEQSNSDPGGNLDLSPLMVDTQEGLIRSAGSVVTVRFGTTTSEGHEACGSFAVFTSGGKSGAAIQALYKTLSIEQVGLAAEAIDNVVEEQFNIESAGGQLDASWIAKARQAADHYAQIIVRNLPGAGLTEVGLMPDDLRMIIHEPAVMAGNFDKNYAPIAAKVRADLIAIYPSR